MGGTEKAGGKTKILKKGGQAGSKGGCLKKGVGGGGLEPFYEIRERWRVGHGRRFASESVKKVKICHKNFFVRC